MTRSASCSTKRTEVMLRRGGQWACYTVMLVCVPNTPVDPKTDSSAPCPMLIRYLILYNMTCFNPMKVEFMSGIPFTSFSNSLKYFRVKTGDDADELKAKLDEKTVTFRFLS